MIELEHNAWLLAILSLGLAGLHPVFPAIDRRIQRNTSAWMGSIGGVAAGYVTLYLLPKIGDMAGGYPADATFRQLQMYYVLLGAVVVYLLMIHLGHGKGSLARLAGTFDYTVYGAYSFLVGYAFIELSSTLVAVNVLIASILGLHQLGMNHLLRSARRQGFDRAARWVFFLLVLIGAFAGLTTELPRAALNTITAFLAGIILVNVIAEELPLVHRQRVPWFLGGVGFYLLASSLVIYLNTSPAY